MAVRNLTEVLESMFNTSIESAMRDTLSDIQWTMNDVASMSNAESEEAVFLTISGHQFRLFVILHFTEEQCLPFVQKALKLKSGDNTDKQIFNDYLLEFGNSLCGIFKRELGNGIKALGMSTPNLLRRESIDLMAMFDISAQKIKRISMNSLPVFFVSYHLLPDIKEEITVDLSVQESVDSGELELF